MRVLVQRVKNADVAVDGGTVAEIGQGLLLFVAIGKEDRREDIERMAKKVANLRIFGDDRGRMNLDIKQAGGEILSVSQFTLYGDTRRGNRPGFDRSAGPEKAKELWETFNALLRENDIEVREGIFAAHMEVSLLNDGPVTIWMDSDQ